MRNVLTMYAV